MSKPTCPECGDSLEVFKWRNEGERQRRGRYFWCNCSGSRGAFGGSGKAVPLCNMCSQAMTLRRGERGEFEGRWFWSCDEHRIWDADVTPPEGPGDPGTLHRRKPVIGGGYAKRKI